MTNKKIFSSIYKKFKYIFFKLLYGKINKVIIAKNHKKIFIKKVFFNNINNYNLYILPNGRVYSDTTMDTAFMLDKNLVKEPSFQYRYKKNFKIINGKIKDNFVVKNGTPNILKKINGNVLSLLTGGAGKTNYWHWIFDVLPRIGILEKSNVKIKPDYYLLPSLSKKYQKQSFKELKISASSLIDGEENKYLESINLLAVDHPININNNPTKSITNIPTWVIAWLKKKFIKKNYNNSNIPKKIFINRESDSNLSARKIINNKEFKNLLTSLGFKGVTLSDLDFKNQIKLFSNVNFIIGLHGAGFANIVFCKKNTKIIEIGTNTSGYLFKSLAKKCQLNYKKIIEKNTLTSLKFQNSHIIVSIEKLKKIILTF